MNKQEKQDFLSGVGEAIEFVTMDDRMEFKGTLSPNLVEQLPTLCDKFLADAEPLLDQVLSAQYTASHAGHDFVLTMGGHGAGFWDGDCPEEIGMKLTELVESKFPDLDCYIYRKKIYSLRLDYEMTKKNLGFSLQQDK